MKNETWKDIVGYEGFYQISNIGRIRSVDRVCGQMPSGSARNIKGKIMTPTDNGKGYKIVSLKKNGGRKSFYIHRLVAEAFLEKPEGSDVVDHLDFDKSNNTASNLRWCTQKENIKHSISNMHVSHHSNTNTGEKYISKKGKLFCLQIRKNGVYKSFSSIEEAVKFRNEVLNGNGIAV